MCTINEFELFISFMSYNLIYINKSLFLCLTNLTIPVWRCDFSMDNWFCNLGKARLLRESNLKNELAVISQLLLLFFMIIKEATV